MPVDFLTDEQAASYARFVRPVGSAVVDAFSTARTLADPCASGLEKFVSGGLFAVGAVAPGGGYSTGARSAARAIGPAGDAGATGLRISAQRQAGHVAGTPQYANRIKQGVPTSAWEPGANVDGLTRHAWQHGTPVPGRPNVQDFDFGFGVGSGPSGGGQSRVRVHMDQQGRIHGHPSGPEYP